MRKAVTMESPDFKEKAKSMVAPHVQSFDLFLTNWLKKFHKYIPPLKFENNGHIISLKLLSGKIGNPLTSDDSEDNKLYPSECRLAQLSYSAQLNLDVEVEFSGEKPFVITVTCGSIPIMLMSKNCNLSGLDKLALITHHEEEYELGGYFIVKGRERIIRLLMAPRSNMPICLARNYFSTQGPGFTKHAVMMRCRREDGIRRVFYAHYHTTKGVVIGTTIGRYRHKIAAFTFLKCFSERSDKQIYMDIMDGVGVEDYTFFSENIEKMMAEFNKGGVFTQKDSLGLLGKLIKKLRHFSESFLKVKSDNQTAEDAIKYDLLIHCETKRQKYNCLISIIKRLLRLANGTITPDTADSVNFNEVFLPGTIYSTILTESIRSFLLKVCYQIKEKTDLDYEKLKNSRFLRAVFKNNSFISLRLESFLKTGNVSNQLASVLGQTSGFTISTERINYPRFISHFKSIHKGQKFLQMRTTVMRKLLPEFWGYICPVHTPDGILCGLLNHLASECAISHRALDEDESKLLTQRIRCYAKETLRHAKNGTEKLKVLLDGVEIAEIDPKHCKRFVQKIRDLKLSNESFSTLEIVPILNETAVNSFPEVLLFSSPNRFIRPVLNLSHGCVEWVGSFEQVFLDIALSEEDDLQGATHRETSVRCSLNSLAALTPFSNFNQSPRNMYQCQMAKQSMGLPYYNLNARFDEKTYLLKSLQTPLVANKEYSEYRFDKHPIGVNAIVCVVAHTGYDMEDAMIINKKAFERGFCHGNTIKCDFKELFAAGERRSKEPLHLSNVDSEGNKVADSLDADGLPYIGQVVSKGDEILCVADQKENHNVSKSKSKEVFSVEQICVTGRSDERNVVFRKLFPRNPKIGDKFSSRHGQKGTLSQLWPEADMPFTAGGIVPDILINPHAFPSRMTIGMFIESMAGKVGALKGEIQDGSAFLTFKAKKGNTAVDYFGEELSKHGFHYYGNEEMYSGISGEKIETEIFIGVVYYQRLRHMILDKSQVRSMGPVNRLTKQPLKGRKNQGGIRFGEMERDSLLAHGTSFLLKDRMLDCSDHYIAVACTKCRSIVSTMKRKALTNSRSAHKVARNYACLTCKSSDFCELINVPFCLVYLLNELASVNIKLMIDFD